MKIGVFDSGIGGKSIAQSLQRDFPEAEVAYVHDHDHVPYGDRQAEEIIRLTEEALQPLLGSGFGCIVIACNTATAAAIEYLRATYPDETFIGLEPMVKPACATTTSGVIAICATPYTLKSERYLDLKKTYAQAVTVLEPDCQNWAAMIEENDINTKIISDVIEELISRGVDVIVLACTHYHWIKQQISSIANERALIIDPSEAISRRVATLLGISLKP